MPVILIFLTAAALLGARVIQVKRLRSRERIASETALRNVYGSVSPLPRLKISSSYGYPAFAVIFRTQTEMKAAAPMEEAFKVEIGKLFEHYGSASRPFDSERAVFFTYESYSDEVLARFRSDYNNNPNV